MEWIKIDGATQEQKKDFNNADPERLMVLFDTDEVRRWDEDDHPVAIIEYWCVLPQKPTSIEH